jgi:hypothetical protein
MFRSIILFSAIVILSHSCNSGQQPPIFDKNTKLLEGIFCKWHQINDTTYELYIQEVNDTCKLYKSYTEIDKTEIHYLKKNGKPNVRVLYIEKTDSLTGRSERKVQALVPIY